MSKFLRGLRNKIRESLKKEGVADKVPFDYVPENFKSKGFNRDGRKILKVNVLGIIDWFKKRKKRRK